MHGKTMIKQYSLATAIMAVVATPAFGDADRYPDQKNDVVDQAIEMWDVIEINNAAIPNSHVVISEEKATVSLTLPHELYPGTSQTGQAGDSK